MNEKQLINCGAGHPKTVTLTPDELSVIMKALEHKYGHPQGRHEPYNDKQVAMGLEDKLTAPS